MQPFPQGHGRSLRVASVLLALLVLLAVVAFASRTGFGHASNKTPTPGYVNWAMSVFLILFVLMIPVAVYAYSVQMREFRVQNRRSMQARAIRSLGIMFIVFGLAGLIVYFRNHSDFLRLNSLLLHHATGNGKNGTHGGANHYTPTFQWPVLWGSLALAVVVVAWFLWDRKQRAAQAIETGDPTIADDVAESISDAIDDLESEPDARRAVIAAYARMEGVFGRHGLRRQASETATEYLQRILLGLTTRVEAVGRLTGLFEQAKFSDHPIDGRMKQDAIDALRVIRDDLRVAEA
jgi:uncharacterized membrane protein